MGAAFSEIGSAGRVLGLSGTPKTPGFRVASVDLVEHKKPAGKVRGAENARETLGNIFLEIGEKCPKMETFCLAPKPVLMRLVGVGNGLWES